MQWWCVAQAVPWQWEWRPYPGVWLFLAAMVAGRILLARRFAVETPSWRNGAFGFGIFLLWLALDWPLGALGASYLASAHMVQYLLVALIAPPFLLLGFSPDEFDAWSPPDSLARVLRLAVHPLIALGLFVVAMAVTHWPPVVDTWMTSQLGSFALDVVWLGSGLLFWWPIVAPRPARSWFREPGKVGYLIAATILNTGVFMYLTYADLPLYAVYELAPPIPWLTSREDQVLAGLFMKIGGGVILWTAITILFARWYQRSEA